MSEKTCETCEHWDDDVCCNDLTNYWSSANNRREGEPCGIEGKLWEPRKQITLTSSDSDNFGINAETRAILARYFHATPEQIDRMQAVTIEARNDQYIKATVVIVGTEPKEDRQ